jgi:phage shock protein A
MCPASPPHGYYKTILLAASDGSAMAATSSLGMLRLFVLACAAPLAAGYMLARPAPHAVPASASLRPAAATATPAAHRSTPAAMNLGERFVRLVKSNVNSALSSLEDPEKVLEQAVNDMQRDLTKVRQAYAEVSASSKRAEEQMKLAEV